MSSAPSPDDDHLPAFVLRRALLFVPAAALGLSACASRPPGQGSGPPQTFRPPAPLSCVPYARELSGIRLSGDAHRWWHAAAGRHVRSQRPAPGAVLVFRGTRALPQGHLAVVVAQTGRREILVNHANWATGRERGQVHLDQPVVDVSAANDWTAVRVWYPPSRTLGRRVWPTFGFIHPPRPRRSEEIVADAWPAAWRAAQRPA